ncbi:MAG: chloride channel protein [Planctomycetes bacterium]|nr:chloride channel protein [Planctomycetota bacterium]
MSKFLGFFRPNGGQGGAGGSFRWLIRYLAIRNIPPTTLCIVLACVIGLFGGLGAVVFTFLIEAVTDFTVRPAVIASESSRLGFVALLVVPAAGLVLVSWFTRRFAPEAQGHGVPEVIMAVARDDGKIRPRVSLVKILASGVCIGTGGSVGREGPIVQIGSALGSMAGQWFGLSPRHVKILVAAGAAAGISATFNAPLAGVIFASEIILGTFAVESLTPIVIASVLAAVVQEHAGEHGFDPAFPHLLHEFRGVWQELPSFFLLGLSCGLAAVLFTKLLYFVEDAADRWLPKWWLRALVLGALVGVAGVVYPKEPPQLGTATSRESQEPGHRMPPLLGVGYQTVAHTLHLENAAKPSSVATTDSIDNREQPVRLDAAQMLAQLWWLLPLVLLKPLMTSVTLGGGGSGGIFAPSLFLGAALGASFGIVANLLFPGLSAHPGVYAIVGMGAVVAGTTHGTLSAILIVYEMTGDYRIILPIMIAAGLSGVVARLIDPESIYMKKLSRREQSIARGHDVHRLEHVMVRDMMRTSFPSVKNTDDLTEIIRVARANPEFEVLPVMNDQGRLVSVIRPGDLQRALDTDTPPQLINAEDIAMLTPVALSTDANLLEALRDFGTSDIESLPVESGRGASRRLVGLLLRSEVMRRYREEMLSRY